MTALRALEPAASHSVLSADLAEAIDILGDAVHRTGPSGARRVPSAGAVFPYETLVLCQAVIDREGPDWGLFRVEGPAGTCSRMGMSPAELRRLAAALPGSGAEGCYLILMARPWLSIRKYGPRGYLYTHLDTAHAATNIVGIALSSGTAVLHAGLPAPAGAILNEFMPFHEPHSVIKLVRSRACAGDLIVTAHAETSVRRTAQAYDFEAQAWSSIVGPFQEQDQSSAAAEPRDIPVLNLPEPAPDMALRAEWRELSAARRSAKGFAATPLTGAQLAATVQALATPLPTTLGVGCTESVGRSAVAATVIINDRLELTPADSVAITRSARLVRYAATTDSMPEDATSFVAACMGQAHVGHSQAFVLLHSPPGLVGPGAAGQDIRQALFRAGASAHLLCLAATREHLAISPIGGYDPTVWARIARLPGGTELLYLLALGTPVAESGPPRNDRAEKAIAHGES